MSWEIFPIPATFSTLFQRLPKCLSPPTSATARTTSPPPNNPKIPSFPLLSFAVPYGIICVDTDDKQVQNKQ